MREGCNAKQKRNRENDGIMDVVDVDFDDNMNRIGPS